MEASSWHKAEISSAAVNMVDWQRGSPIEGAVNCEADIKNFARYFALLFHFISLGIAEF